MLRVLHQLAILGVFWAILGGLVFWLHPQARGLFSGSQAAVPQVEGEISLAEAKLLGSQGKAFWVDVRPAAEFAAEHVPGAENIPADLEGGLETKLFEWTRSGALTPSTTMIIYCASSGCGTSHQLRTQLLAMKPEFKVSVLAGGPGWPDGAVERGR